MAEKFTRAFFAYPGTPNDLTSPIETAATGLERTSANVKLDTWPQLEVFGANIPDDIRGHINTADVLVCDITLSNQNVYYEIGFAIGQGKAIAPVLNVSFAGAEQDIKSSGFFDNIGYAPYENSAQLLQILQNLPSTKLLELYGKDFNHNQPIYFLNAFRKTDFINAIVSAIKHSKVFFRSFDPVETPRFAVVPMISAVSASSGTIIPLLPDHVDDAPNHNLRAAFLSGLSHGLGRDTLLVQREAQGKINPTDFREFITTVRNEGEIFDTVKEFSKNAVISGQAIKSSNTSIKRNQLQLLSMGATAAENEFRTLGDYYVETAEFIKALRGEAHVITGRKGAGKTAMFYRVRDTFRRERDTVVVDLKPESHQLSTFREELLKIVGTGTFDHTLAAFWYFLLLSETLLIIKNNYEARAKYDGEALSASREIALAMEDLSQSETGDFTTRINRLGKFVIEEIQRAQKEGKALSPERLTNVIFREGISRIRELILNHTNDNTRIILLFDNIDKGWPASGLNEFDVRQIRLLLEALNKVERDMHNVHRDFMSIVFLRNDVYELLVAATPDRGKSAQIGLDWTDRAKLRLVIYKRLQNSTPKSNKSFEQIWGDFFPTSIKEKDAFEYFVDHSLMRPRFLLNIIENAIANAINRGREKVSVEDCLDAVSQHSHYLVSDFGYEIKDVSGLAADIFYAFIGANDTLSKEEVVTCLTEFEVPQNEIDEAVKLLLWYGALGVVNPSGEHKFIYDYQYDAKRLDAEIRRSGADVRFSVNPAFHVALR